MLKVKKIFSALVGAAMAANVFMTMPFSAFADEETSRTYTYDDYGFFGSNFIRCKGLNKVLRQYGIQTCSVHSCKFKIMACHNRISTAHISKNMLSVFGFLKIGNVLQGFNFCSSDRK